MMAKNNGPSLTILIKKEAPIIMKIIELTTPESSARSCQMTDFLKEKMADKNSFMLVRFYQIQAKLGVKSWSLGLVHFGRKRISRRVLKASASLFKSPSEGLARMLSILEITA